MYNSLDIPKYQKRKNSTASKAKRKSNHKHVYKEYLIIEGSKPYYGEVCCLCGRVNHVDYLESEPLGDGRYRVLSAEEIYEKHSDLEQVYVDCIWRKYVTIDTRNTEK